VAQKVAIVKLMDRNQLQRVMHRERWVKKIQIPTLIVQTGNEADLEV
jgi:hypothetical protein